MKLLLRILLAVAFLALLDTATPVFAQTTIDFETPNLGADSRQINNPYVASGVTFTAEPVGFGDEVVGLVKNSATSACADPSSDDQKLGTGRDDGTSGGSIGLSGFPIRATFAAPLAPPVTVSAEFQTLAGKPIRIRLFSAANVEVGSITDTASPAAGQCGYPGGVRARKTITVTAGLAVAYALLDLDAATGGSVFVVDDFEFSGTAVASFPAVAGDDVTKSLGSFRILVHPSYRPLMAGVPGYDPTTGTLQSPNLFDPNTHIGRSAPHLDADATDAGGTPVGTAGTVVSDSSFGVVPAGFETPGTREVHTEVRSLNMTSWQCAGIPGVAVRAGIDAPGRPISPGEVEALGTADFPAESFFNVFAEIDIPPMAGFPGGTLYNRSTDPLLIVNQNLLSFPPEVVYVHANTNAVPVRFLNDNPGFWSANQLFGWLVLAGHAVGFDCGDSDLDDTLSRTPEQQPKPLEIDHFRFSQAQITLQVPTSLGVDKLVVDLEGPATVHVQIDESTGAAEDSDQNRLDDVQTEMVALELRGGSPALPVLVRLDPDQRSFGKIEETVNITPGLLELPPFAPTGTADSFFDVFTEILIGPSGPNQLVLHPAQALHMQATISHKPPGPGETYTNPFVPTEGIPLLDANGGTTGYVILDEIHTPRPPIEIDQFNTTGAVVGIRLPNDKLVNAVLRGPTTIKVALDSLQDANTLGVIGPNKLEEVDTEIVALQLTGNSPLGLISLRAGSDFGLPRSKGQIEEKENRQGGRLDLPGPDAPFCTPDNQDNCDNTQANSFFDVFFDVSVPGIGTLHNNDPLRLESMIDRKPPKRIYQHVLTEPIELFDEKNQPTGIFLETAAHNTDPVEVDHFELTRALVGFQMPNGSLQTTVLGGPATVHVDLASLNDLRTLGRPGANGLEEINTEIVKMELTNSAGTIKLKVGREHGLPASRGQIEERENKQTGRLDLKGPDAPLCTPPVPADCVGTQANSFFNVFFEVEVDVAGVTMLLHNREPLRLEAVIDEKPPMKRYRHVITEPIELFDRNRRPTGVFLVTAEHNTGPVEVDEFEATSALVGLRMKDGSLVNTILGGPATVEVALASLSDADGNLKEEVATELIQMELANSAGTVKLRAGRVFGLPASIGQIEEKENKKDGRLDLPGPDAPFCTPPVPADCQGAKANSYFDVFFEVSVTGAGVLHNKIPLRIEAMISQKPPKTRYIHVITDPIELFDENSRPTGIFLVTAEHNTGAAVEHDLFEDAAARLRLIKPDGSEETIALRGLTRVDVFFEDEKEGDAGDDNGNGLDEVYTLMQELKLTGMSSVGSVEVTLNPNKPSNGLIEEKINNTPGTLDIPPFTPTGGANSSFDLYLQIRVGDVVLYNHKPKILRSMITHKPPAQGDTYESPEVIALFDANGNETGFALGTARHVPVPPNSDTTFQRARARIVIQTEGGKETILLQGPAIIRRLIDPSCKADDSNNNDLDDAQTEIVSLNLQGTSPTLGLVILRLNPRMRTAGMIEERTNNMPGILEVPSCVPGSAADSFFDVWTEISIGGSVSASQVSAEKVLHTTKPIRLTTQSSSQNPGVDQPLEGTISEPIELVDENEQPSGLSLVDEFALADEFRLNLPSISR